MTPTNYLLIETDKFQLTHPWGCDLLIYTYHKNHHISTHTPVRVWHPFCTNVMTQQHISTHTPVRVWHIALFLHLAMEFQLTHPWGCDQRVWNSTKQAYISTHTPVRVWLTNSGYIIKLAHDFNSHTREGVTFWHRHLVSAIRFQLTHPWGCDVRQRKSYNTQIISTHTPVRVWHTS